MIDCDTLFGVWPRRKLDASLDKLLEIMTTHRVARFCSLSTTGIFYDYEKGNEETLRASSEHPRMIPVGTVDLRRYSGGGDLVRNLSRRGFKALRLFPDLQGWPLDYAPFLQVTEEAQDIGFPLIVSVGALGAITQISRAIEQYDTPIIVTGINYGQFSEALAVMRANQNIHVGTSLFSTPDAYEVFAQEAGSERLIFGSHSPIHYFSSSSLALERAEIGEDDRQHITIDNIERLLG